MPHRCEDPLCWRDDGTHAPGCVFWLANASPPQVLLMERGRHVHGQPAKVCLNPPERIVSRPGGPDVRGWDEPPEGSG